MLFLYFIFNAWKENQLESLKRLMREEDEAKPFTK